MDLEPLEGTPIHAFHTIGQLNIDQLKIDAATRWFKPNEVHAILSNPTVLNVQPHPPVTPPESGSLFLYDREVVKYYRNDGHNWKMRKCGKYVLEGHYKLKVGNEERVNAYYARGEDDPNFQRRCYWLLDKKSNHIVLVHYRKISEVLILACHSSLLVRSPSGDSN